MDRMAAARYFKDDCRPSQFSDSDNEYSADGTPHRRADHTCGSRGRRKQKRHHEGSAAADDKRSGKKQHKDKSPASKRRDAHDCLNPR